MKKHQKGFTIIELVVVVVIIALLSSIVVVGTNNILKKTKYTRLYSDAANIKKALYLFYSKYGDYPASTTLGCSPGDTYCYKIITSEVYPYGYGGEPYLTVDGDTYYLNEFYKVDWTSYNATYYSSDGYYYIYLRDYDGDGKIGCGSFRVRYSNSSKYKYFYFICEDCPNYCEYEYEN